MMKDYLDMVRGSLVATGLDDEGKKSIGLCLKFNLIIRFFIDVIMQDMNDLNEGYNESTPNIAGMSIPLIDYKI